MTGWDYPFDDDPNPRREVPSGDMRGVSFGQTPAAQRLRHRARQAIEGSPGQRKRHRRNLAIMLCREAGMSHYFLADAFDLPKSTVNEIVQAYQARYGNR